MLGFWENQNHDGYYLEMRVGDWDAKSTGGFQKGTDGNVKWARE